MSGGNDDRFKGLYKENKALEIFSRAVDVRRQSSAHLMDPERCFHQKASSHHTASDNEPGGVEF